MKANGIFSLLLTLKPILYADGLGLLLMAKARGITCLRNHRSRWVLLLPEAFILRKEFGYG